MEEATRPPSYEGRASRDPTAEAGKVGLADSRETSWGRGTALRQGGGIRLPGPARVYSRCPMDTQSLEPKGRVAAILEEAVTWLHFEWGQNLPTLPASAGQAGS